MTIEEIEALSEEELLAVMRRVGVNPVHSLYASIHDTQDEMNEIGNALAHSDVARWRLELSEHFGLNGDRQ